MKFRLPNCGEGLFRFFLFLFFNVFFFLFSFECVCVVCMCMCVCVCVCVCVCFFLPVMMLIHVQRLYCKNHVPPELILSP